MITTITMNTAIDKAYVLTGANVPGQVMRMSECRMTAGGKGLNVARVLKAIGEEVCASGLVGGHAGRWVLEKLDADGIKNDFEIVSGETRSCINIIEPDGRQTEFLEPGLTVTQADLDAFMARFERLVGESRIIAISGSLPRGTDEKLYPTLIEICRAQKKPVLLDTSGKNLIAGVQARPTLIKPNTDEIRQLLGRDIDTHDTDAVIRAAKAIRDEAGIDIVAVSMGGEGSVAVGREGCYRARPPKLQAVSTVGCGDSMIAGFASGMVKGLSLAETLRFATAVSAANALELTTGFVRMENVNRLMGEAAVEPL